MARHSQSCKMCKTRVLELLTALYGDAVQNHSLRIKQDLESFRGQQCFGALKTIYSGLTRLAEPLQAEGRLFVSPTRRLSPVDFYALSPRLIVEFDESQHFTAARAKALSLYPDDLHVGFDTSRWIGLCHELDKHDRDKKIPWRDQQRAWLDTLRDFTPLMLGGMPTVRLYARDCIWCELDPRDDEHVSRFRTVVEG